MKERFTHPSEEELLFDQFVTSFIRSREDRATSSSSPSDMVKEKYLSNSDPELLSGIAEVATSVNWRYINKGLLSYPQICKECCTGTCEHMVQLYSQGSSQNTPVVAIWNDTRYAQYCQEQLNTALEFGLRN